MKYAKINKNKWYGKLGLTDHFMKRYNERILNSKHAFHSIKDYIYDLDRRLNDREKEIILFFKDSKRVKVPMNNHSIIMKNGSLITIY